MWTKNRSSSPTASIGDTSASNTSAIPVQNEIRRQAGTGVPRRASVAARRAYSTATTTVGRSWSGSSVHCDHTPQVSPISGG
jgi:hypothetical protein